MTHKDVYMKSLNICRSEVVLCEVCGRVAVDVHHILFKSQGGTNDIENLIALDRHCHDVAHGKVKGEELTREQLFEITGKRS